MKIGIYNEPSSGGIGGSEYCAAVLAEAFDKDHDVTIIHHNEGLNKQLLADAFSVRLEETTLQCRPVEPLRGTHARLPWRRLGELRAWQADVSSPFDVFVAVALHIPPFCHARQGLLIVLFPWCDHSERWSLEQPGAKLRPRIRLRQWYRQWEWLRRFRSYKKVWTISEFTAKWTRRRWGIDGQVVYPPVEIQFAEVPKERIILSVGRLTPQKKQLELVNAFCAVSQTSLKGWKLCCVGGLRDVPSDRKYYAQLQRAAAQGDVALIPNADRATVTDLLQRASIFWHGMGCGEDADKAPQFNEHFGISTVEAMAAGCVPVVINRGGQAEIVQESVNGFRWDALSELTERTTQLAQDEVLRAAMSKAARIRAQDFSKQRFIEHFADFLETCAR